jgi:hypothetical protein
MFINRVGYDLIKELKKAWVIGNLSDRELFAMRHPTLLGMSLNRSNVHTRTKQDMLNVG